MAVKTITIDIEAYEALAAQKEPGQSFSQVIKQHFARRRTARDLVNLLGTMKMSEATLDAIERAVGQRRNEIARPVDL